VQECSLFSTESKKDRYKDLDENKQKKRLNDFLLRRGFDWEIVKEVIAEKWKVKFQSDMLENKREVYKFWLGFLKIYF